jgi:prolyl-tRNA synthetase
MLRVQRGIELGHCFKLGTRYTERTNITFNDADGQEKPMVMGSYGIGVGRLMAAIVEEHHDDYGIVWPASVAPYAVHMVVLAKEGEVFEKAQSLYKSLSAAGIDVLYDDRPDLSAGVKFNDADLIGCPLRITVSKRSLKNGGVEVKRRNERDREIISFDDIYDFCH